MKTTFTLTDLHGLMPRDRWAIDMLAEHRALTTDQLTALGYDPTPTGTARRLRTPGPPRLARPHRRRLDAGPVRRPDTPTGFPWAGSDPQPVFRRPGHPRPNPGRHRPSRLAVRADRHRRIGKVRDLAATTSEPIVCVVLTDGDPDDRKAATKVVVDLARFPVFVKFLPLRDVPYLRKLDDMDGRLVDNVDAKTIPDPTTISDEAFAEAMVDELDTWLTAARTAGILT